MMGAGMYSAAQIARILGLNEDAVRKRLERWRCANAASDAYVESEGKRKNQAKFFYRWNSVRCRFPEAGNKASDGMSGERPTNSDDWLLR